MRGGRGRWVRKVEGSKGRGRFSSREEGGGFLHHCPCGIATGVKTKLLYSRGHSAAYNTLGLQIKRPAQQEDDHSGL